MPAPQCVMSSVRATPPPMPTHAHFLTPQGHPPTDPYPALNHFMTMTCSAVAGTPRPTYLPPRVLAQHAISAGKRTYSTRQGWECRGKGQANQPPQPDSDQPAHGGAGCLRRRRRRLLLLDLYRARHTKPDALAHDYDDGALQVAQHGCGLCVGEARLSVD